MAEQELHVVTGAFGYSGRYIARRLLAAGRRVVTLTGSPGRAHDLGRSIEARPFRFDDPAAMAESLRGAAVLYNTYWVRFNHRDFRQADAVRNSIALFEAARAAGVRRVVHVSITNPSEDSPLEYFRGKARLESALTATGLSHAVLRPAVLFGPEDVLVNNIAWFLRRFPVFGVFGRGDYRLRPIHVDDFAALAVQAGTGRDDVVIDAVGPETFTYRELIQALGDAIGRHPALISIPPAVGLAVSRAVGAVVGDVPLTRDEIEGLMAGLLYTRSAPTGSTRLTDWARANAATLGARYASELARRRDRLRAYRSL